MTLHNILELPSRSMIHRSIWTLDGARRIASAGFTGRQPDIWGWVTEWVAHEVGCHPDDVKVLETDDGDVLTADGRPVYLLRPTI